jgi:hypothetical protein
MLSVALSDRASRRRRWSSPAASEWRREAMVQQKAVRRDAIAGHHYDGWERRAADIDALGADENVSRRKPAVDRRVSWFPGRSAGGKNRRRRCAENRRGGCLLHNDKGAGAVSLPRAGRAETR